MRDSAEPRPVRILAERWDELNCRLVVRQFSVYRNQVRVREWSSPIFMRDAKQPREQHIMRRSDKGIDFWIGRGFIEELNLAMAGAEMISEGRQHARSQKDRSSEPV